MINICIKKGWLQKDPFLGFKMTKHEVDRDFLTDEELQTIAAKVFNTDRLNHVRDIFLFSCYTGLAYADVQKLQRTEISRGIDGDYRIFTSRKKTETRSLTEGGESKVYLHPDHHSVIKIGAPSSIPEPITLMPQRF